MSKYALPTEINLDQLLADIPKLFDHTYDIDDVIHAFLNDKHSTHWLNTENGTITQEKPTNTKADHLFQITPLPLSFLDTLKTHPKRNTLEEDELKALDIWLAQTKRLHTLIPLLAENRAGGWLRERVKDATLDWLDLNNLIPPSMRHVRDDSLFNSPPTEKKVKVSVTSE